MQITCERCNGRGGWVGWPGYDCYGCNGRGFTTDDEPKPERRRRCKECGSSHKPSEEHWNGLYTRICACGIGHQRPQCPQCGATHADIANLKVF